MSELRWNPVLQEWVVTATHRMDRPQMPKDWCPFCPGSGRVPEKYDVYLYPNDFPTFAVPPPPMDVTSEGLFKTAPSEGYCDVVLYSPDHNTSLTLLPIDHIVTLIHLWRDRFAALEKDKKIQYVFIFENKGEVIGVTMPHPHGQIYSFSYIPPKIQKELDSAKEYFEKEKCCLFCDILKQEKSEKKRVVGENQSFTAVIPFYARWPYEIHITSQRHIGKITEFTESEILDMAKILKFVLMKYDNLYGFSFPYMMVMHQSPTSGGKYPYYHWHIEFYPPYRSRTKLKYLAGCESGTGTFINDSIAEEKAEELRQITPKKISDVK